jgi:hypothetical protein
VSLQSVGSHQTHGPCHRCGWVMDVSPVSRKSARQLGIRPHLRVCDECLTDLRRDKTVVLITGDRARATHRRYVA